MKRRLFIRNSALIAGSTTTFMSCSQAINSSKSTANQSNDISNDLNQRVIVAEQFASNRSGYRNGTADATQAIVDAINAAKNEGGAIVDLGIGTRVISNEIIIDHSSILLFGHGAGAVYVSNGVIQDKEAATVLLWDSRVAGKRMVVHQTPDGTNDRITGGGVQGMTIHGANTATDCLEVLSVGLSRYENLVANSATGFGYSFGVKTGSQDAGTTGGCVFENLYYGVNGSFSGNTSTGMLLWGKGLGTSDPVQNCSLNKFGYIDLVTQNGNALVFEDSDGCQFSYVRAVSINNGNAVVFHADDTGTSGKDPNGGNTNARQHKIDYLQTGGSPIISKATVGGSVSAQDNYLYVSGGNGTPKPIIEQGSHLFYIISTSDSFGSGGNFGINFGGSEQSALNNYQEIDFSTQCYLGGSSTDGSHSYSIKTAVGTRIGRMFFYEINLDVDKLDTNITGILQVKGLPFSAMNKNTYISLANVHLNNIDLPSGMTQFSARVFQNTDFIQLQAFADNGNEKQVDANTINSANPPRIILSGHYIVK